MDSSTINVSSVNLSPDNRLYVHPLLLSGRRYILISIQIVGHFFVLWLQSSLFSFFINCNTTLCYFSSPSSHTRNVLIEIHTSMASNLFLYLERWWAIIMKHSIHKFWQSFSQFPNLGSFLLAIYFLSSYTEINNKHLVCFVHHHSSRIFFLYLSSEISSTKISNEYNVQDHRWNFKYSWW